MNVHFELFIFLALTCVSQHLLLANGGLHGEELIETENIDSPMEIVRLDISNDKNPFWTFSKGWFQYFDDISNIPENIEQDGSKYTVGFPPGFIQEDVLGAEGLWMMVHEDIPPDSDYPLPYVDFQHVGMTEFHSIEIKYYLHGNISIELIHEDSDIDPVRIENNENLNNEWDTIFIQTAPFKNLRMQFHLHNWSFVIVDRISVSTQQFSFQNSINSYEQAEAGPGTNSQEITKDLNPYANENSQQRILDIRTYSNYNLNISEGWFSYFKNSYDIPDDGETETESVASTFTESTTTSQFEGSTDDTKKPETTFSVTSRTPFPTTNTRFLPIIVLDFKNDTIKPSSWTNSEGWFSYFNNSYEIPDDVEYGGIPYTVGFPPGFIKQDFLYTVDGLWMTVHDEFPPDFEVPKPYINFTSNYLYPEYDTVEIKCLLYDNSSLQLTFGGSDDHQFTFSNSDTSKYEWDDFCISPGPFRKFQMKILTEGNSSFVIVDKIVVTRFEEPSTTVGTSTTEYPSTTETNSHCSEMGTPSTTVIPDPSNEPEETTVTETTETASTETESISTTEEITINPETTTFTDRYYETTKPSGVIKLSYNLQLVHNCLLAIVSLRQMLN